MRMGTLRAINLRLTTMRRQIGPQRRDFERIGEEIGQVENLVSDSEAYSNGSTASSTGSSTGSTPPPTRWRS